MNRGTIASVVGLAVSAVLAMAASDRIQQQPPVKPPVIVKPNAEDGRPVILDPMSNPHLLLRCVWEQHGYTTDDALRMATLCLDRKSWEAPVLPQIDQETGTRPPALDPLSNPRLLLAELFQANGHSREAASEAATLCLDRKDVTPENTSESQHMVHGATVLWREGDHVLSRKVLVGRLFYEAIFGGNDQAPPCSVPRCEPPSLLYLKLTPSAVVESGVPVGTVWLQVDPNCRLVSHRHAGGAMSVSDFKETRPMDCDAIEKHCGESVPPSQPAQE